MRSLKLFLMLVKLALIVESAVAGVVFLVIAITALINPALVETVKSFDCFARAWAFAEYCLPNLPIHSVVVASAFLLGFFNLTVAMVAKTKKWQLKGEKMAQLPQKILLYSVLTVTTTIYVLTWAFFAVAALFVSIWLMFKAFSVEPWYSLFCILGSFAVFLGAAKLSEAGFPAWLERWQHSVYLRWG